MNAEHAIPPQVRARIRRQGLILGAVALLIALVAVIRFAVFGLPKDPDVSAVIEQRQSAEVAAETAHLSETMGPAAPATANEDTRR